MSNAYSIKIVSPSRHISGHVITLLGKLVTELSEGYASLSNLTSGKEVDLKANKFLAEVEKNLVKARTNRDFYDYKSVRNLVVATPKGIQPGYPNLSIGIQTHQGTKPYIIVSGNFEWVALTTSE